MAPGQFDAVENEVEVLEVQGLGLALQSIIVRSDTDEETVLTTIPSHSRRMAGAEGLAPASSKWAGHSSRDNRADKRRDDSCADRAGVR